MATQILTHGAEDRVAVPIFLMLETLLEMGLP